MSKKQLLGLATALSLAALAKAGIVQADNHSDMRKESPTNSHLRQLAGSKISIRTGDKTFIVDLYDNPTAKDLLKRLPLAVKANNYPGYDEKVIRLPEGLSMEGSPPGDDPEIPEVGYYDPGQWIALYYGQIGYWSGKVPLGRIHATIDELRAIPDSAPLVIEIAQ